MHALSSRSTLELAAAQLRSPGHARRPVGPSAPTWPSRPRRIRGHCVFELSCLIIPYPSSSEQRMYDHMHATSFLWILPMSLWFVVPCVSVNTVKVRMPPQQAHIYRHSCPLTHGTQLYFVAGSSWRTCFRLAILTVLSCTRQSHCSPF
jgi:hypothetical protein